MRRVACVVPLAGDQIMKQGEEARPALTLELHIGLGGTRRMAAAEGAPAVGATG